MNVDRTKAHEMSMEHGESEQDAKIRKDNTELKTLVIKLGKSSQIGLIVSGAIILMAILLVAIIIRLYLVYGVYY